MVGDGGGLMHKMEGFYRIEMVLFFSPPAVAHTQCCIVGKILSGERNIYRKLLLKIIAFTRVVVDPKIFPKWHMSKF